MLVAAPGTCVAADGPLPADRAAIAACLKKETEKPENCVGRIFQPCADKPEGQTTAGTNECADREYRAWDERLNADYKAVIAGSLGQTDADPQNRPADAPRKTTVKGAEIIRDMQRAWLAFRTRKCDTAAMQFEGGTMAGNLRGMCLYEETARQAIWLHGLATP
jgi:uncharacterized protein YecT (DUF1311 family)